MPRHPPEYVPPPAKWSVFKPENMRLNKEIQASRNPSAVCALVDQHWEMLDIANIATAVRAILLLPRAGTPATAFDDILQRLERLVLERLDEFTARDLTGVVHAWSKCKVLPC
jgi:hypothetical protein